ncbi:MAG: hypothetical protein ACLTG4_12235 [Oscillospiraceae bacterium]
MLALAEQVVRLPGCYHYLQREGSAMNNKNCARNVEILYAFDDILGWFGEHGLREAYRDELTFLAISHLLIAASVRVARIDCKSELLGQFRDYMEKNFPDFRENRYLPRLDRNKRLVYRLLLKRRYRAVRLLFRVKDALITAMNSSSQAAHQFLRDFSCCFQIAKLRSGGVFAILPLRRVVNLTKAN